MSTIYTTNEWKGHGKQNYWLFAFEGVVAGAY